MISLALAYSYASLLLLLTALLQSFVPKAYTKKPVNLLVTVILLGTALMLRIDGVPLFHYLRGYLSDLSISFTLYLFSLILHRIWNVKFIKPAEREYFIGLVILGALILYPHALGATQLDTYRFGYTPQTFLLLLFGMGLLFWYVRFYFLVVLLTSASLGFALNLLESNNLWDYLIDPLISIVFIMVGLMSALKAGAARLTDHRSR